MTLLANGISALESLQRENEELREKAALHSADAKTAWAECDELRNLSDRLKQEAKTHAIEARGANATVNEIYQIISGGKGEPGNWNGAKPVRAYVKVAKGEILRLETELALSKPAYSRRRLEARAEAAEAEVKRLTAPNTIECACTKVAQDETCHVGYPSLLCETCDGKGVLPYVELDGPELWEIVFGVNDDVAGEITDEQYDQIAKAINDVFIAPLRASQALASKGGEHNAE